MPLNPISDSKVNRFLLHAGMIAVALTIGLESIVKSCKEWPNPSEYHIVAAGLTIIAATGNTWKAISAWNIIKQSKEQKLL